jgi:hypothetical protein
LSPGFNPYCEDGIYVAEFVFGNSNNVYEYKWDSYVTYDNECNSNFIINESGSYGSITWSLSDIQYDELNGKWKCVVEAIINVTVPDQFAIFKWSNAELFQGIDGVCPMGIDLNSLGLDDNGDSFPTSINGDPGVRPIKPSIVITC